MIAGFDFSSTSGMMAHGRNVKPSQNDGKVRRPTAAVQTLAASAASQGNSSAFVPDPPFRSSASRMISDSLNGLTATEREQVSNEVHGVVKMDGDSNTDNAPSPQHEPEFQQQQLQKMEEELQTLKRRYNEQVLQSEAASAQNQQDLTSTNPSTAEITSSEVLPLDCLLLAETQNLDYINNPRFRLKFLQCEDWDPAKAAARLVRHLDWKNTLFGPQVLARDIQWDDLYPEDQRSLKKGYTQRLPARDRTGRAVYCLIYLGQQYQSVESLARQWFFMAWMDAETDRLGVVQVTFRIREPTFVEEREDIDTYRFLHRAGSDMPVRIVALHKFVEPETESASPDGDGGEFSRMHMLMDVAIQVFEPEVRSRVRIHAGSYLDWMRDIRTFGIPDHLIPLTSEYKIKTKNHMDYLTMLKRAKFVHHVSKGSVEITDLPSNKDILLGKGKPIQESVGNLALSVMIDQYVSSYQKSTKFQKTALANYVVRLVKSNGGRFLSKDKGVWMIVSDDLAREKVSHMFRHQRQKTGAALAKRGNLLKPEEARTAKKLKTYS